MRSQSQLLTSADYICMLMLCLIFCKCSSKDEVNTAFLYASADLSEVLTYYKQQPEDSLKLKAASFLITNMHDHFSQIKSIAISNDMRQIYEAADSTTKETYFTSGKQDVFRFSQYMHSIFDEDEVSPSADYVAQLIQNQ